MSDDRPPEDENDKGEDESSSSTSNHNLHYQAGQTPSGSISRQTGHDERSPQINQNQAQSSTRRSLNTRHSMDMTAIRDDPLSKEIHLEPTGSKGKSASLDAMAWLPFQRKPFRSSKVTPTVGYLGEVITISQVTGVPTSCDGTRNPSCVPSQIVVGDAGVHPGGSASTDSMENICRICHDSPMDEKLITPCLCKGSMAKVHRTCLERWLSESGEICGQEYNTVRVPKHTGVRSFVAWIRNPLTPTDSRNFFFDLACFFILTPLACLSAWLCVLGAKSYGSDEHKSGRKNFLNETQEARANRDASNSLWTSAGLLSLTGTLVTAYYIWMFVAVRYHLQVWKEWQLRNFIVTIIPLANGNYCFQPPPPRAKSAVFPNDSSDVSIASRFLRRDYGNDPIDRNNNSNNNCTQNRQCPMSPRPAGSAANIRTDTLQRSSNNGEISDTALFYQSIFGVDSDESISEEAMIRLATLRSKFDARMNPKASASSILTNEKAVSSVNSDVSKIPGEDLDSENKVMNPVEVGVMDVGIESKVEANTDATVILIDSDDSICTVVRDCPHQSSNNNVSCPQHPEQNNPAEDLKAIVETDEEVVRILSAK